ncbi:MAG TPA: TonB family protein [bacterium]|nr:TonB family protein [bacterium]
MRSGRVILAALTVALAAGAGAAVWRHTAVPIQRSTGSASGPSTSSAAPGPTAQQEGDRPAGIVTAPLPRPVDEAARRPPASAPMPPEVSRRPAARPTAPPGSWQQRRSSAAQIERQAAPPDSGRSADTRVVSAPVAGPAAGSTAPPGAPGSSGPAAGAAGEGAGGRSGAGVTGSASGGAQEDASRPAARVPVVSPPRVISTGPMAYPGDAFRLTVRRQDLGASLAVVGTEGTVALRVLVLADGTVRGVEAVESSGAGVLDRSAVEAVRGWQFAPATRDGAPIDAYVTLRIRYVVR